MWCVFAHANHTGPVMALLLYSQPHAWHIYFIQVANVVSGSFHFWQQLQTDRCWYLQQSIGSKCYSTCMSSLHMLFWVQLRCVRAGFMLGLHMKIVPSASSTKNGSTATRKASNVPLKGASCICTSTSRGRDIGDDNREPIFAVSANVPAVCCAVICAF